VVAGDPLKTSTKGYLRKLEGVVLDIGCGTGGKHRVIKES